MTRLFYSSLAAHISLIRLVQHMTASLKYNVTFENDIVMLLEEAKVGTRKMYAPHASIKLLVNQHSVSVFWQQWMATILSSLSTVPFDRD